METKTLKAVTATIDNVKPYGDLIDPGSAAPAGDRCRTRIAFHQGTPSKDFELKEIAARYPIELRQKQQ